MLSSAHQRCLQMAMAANQDVFQQGVFVYVELPDSMAYSEDAARRHYGITNEIMNVRPFGEFAGNLAEHLSAHDHCLVLATGEHVKDAVHKHVPTKEWDLTLAEFNLGR
jgi:hypothetical protein